MSEPLAPDLGIGGDISRLGDEADQTSQQPGQADHQSQQYERALAAGIGGAGLELLDELTGAAAVGAADDLTALIIVARAIAALARDETLRAQNQPPMDASRYEVRSRCQSR